MAVGGFWARKFAAGIAGALVVWAMGIALALWVGDPLYVAVFGGFGFAVAPGTLLVESWKWSTVDRRVVFFDANVFSPVGVLAPPASLLPGR